MKADTFMDAVDKLATQDYFDRRNKRIALKQSVDNSRGGIMSRINSADKDIIFGKFNIDTGKIESGVRYSSKIDDGQINLEQKISELNNINKSRLESITKKDGNIIPTSTQEVIDFYNKAITNKNFKGTLYIGVVSNKIVDSVLSEVGIDLSNYLISITADDFRHLHNQHSKDSEILRGQKPFNINVFHEIINGIYNHTDVYKENIKRREYLVFERRVNNLVTAVTKVSIQRQHLRLITGWATKKGRTISLTPNTTSNIALELTSETHKLSSSSTNNIQQDNENVKTTKKVKSKNVRYSKKLNKQTPNAKNFIDAVAKVLEPELSIESGIWDRIEKEVINNFALTNMRPDKQQLWNAFYEFRDEIGDIAKY
mgnify:CR=1 FL=1